MRITLGLLLSIAAFGQNRAPAIETIRKDEMKADLFFLASDAMRGRLTGSPEYALAAEWIAARYARLGLQSIAPDGSFFHRFDLSLARLGDGNRLSVSSGPDARRMARQGEDFYPLIFSADAEARGTVACKGFGITAPELGWDDYKGGSASGIVMIFDGEPAPADPNGVFDGLVTSEYANSLRKAINAQAHGASAVLIVNPRMGAFSNAARVYWPEKAPHLERYTLASYVDQIHIPALQISPAMATRILGRDLAPLLQEAAKGAGRVTIESGATVELAASLSRTIVADRSVVGKIEGSDPKLKGEAVIVSAHYDHNGADGAQIYNGADDNASGTVAVLDIAEAYMAAAQQGKRPRRTVIFAVWGSEERCCGPLLGSWAWVERPLWPLENTAATINMDMIGRSEEIPESGGPRFAGLQPQTAASNANSVNVMGYSYSADLAKVMQSANREMDLTLKMDYDNNASNLLRRSDQWPFLKRGVPAIFVHTGLHPDYHTVNDRPERIDYAKVERVARLVYQASWDLAQSESRPKLDTPRRVPAPR